MNFQKILAADSPGVVSQKSGILVERGRKIVFILKQSNISTKIFSIRERVQLQQSLGVSFVKKLHLPFMSSKQNSP